MSDERRDLIESKISEERSKTIAISGDAGGLDIKDMAQLFEAAKFMSQAKVMIPQFLQQSPWDCLGIILQAREWRMSPFAVARMAYVTENPRTKEKQLGFMAQLVHAVLETRAPIKGRMAIRYEGEGDDRVCIVSATLSHALGGETKEHRSPRLGDRRPKPQTKTNRETGEKYTTTAGSPLWYSKPDVQLAYDTQRDFARIYFPDVLMGVYTDDELKEAGFEEIPAKDLARMPAVAQVEHEESLSSRLSPDAIKRAGFDIGQISAEIAKNAPQGDPQETPASPTEPKSSQAAAEVEQAGEGGPESGEATPTDPSSPPFDPDPAAPPPLPTTDDEYEKHVRDYCLKATNATDLAELWTSERRMRAQIPNLTPEGLDRCKEIVKGRAQELMRAQGE